MKDRAWAYILVVLPVSWLVQTVLFAGWLPGQFLPLYMFVPALVAFLFYLSGKNPFNTQAALFTRRTALWPWLFAVLYPLFWLSLVVLTGVATGLGTFNPGFLPTLFSWSFLPFFAGLVFMMLPSVFGEEYGWRGYLLPALAEGRGKLWATIIVGLVWGLWHIPSYYIVYNQAGLGNPVLLTILGVITVALGAFPYTYLFFWNGNLLPCVLMHAVYDMCIGHLFIGAPAVPGLAEAGSGLMTIPWPYAQVLLIATGTVLALFFARQFKKMK